MSIESSSYGENGKVPEYILVQDALSRALESEQVVEIIDFNFSRNGNVTPKTFDLGSAGIISVDQSSEYQKTHTLTLSNIPPENQGKIFVMGYPYYDSSKYDEAVGAILAEQSEEENNAFYERLGNRPSRPTPYLPFRPTFYSSDSLEVNRKKGDDYKLELDRYSDKFSADMDTYNRQMREKIDREEKQDEAIRQKYNSRIWSVNIESELRYSVSFFTQLQLDQNKTTAKCDFLTGVDSASLYVPYQPLSFDAFKDKSTLQLFLSFLTKDEQSVSQWAEYFSKSKENFPVQARLAISQKIQEHGGKIE